MTTKPPSTMVDMSAAEVGPCSQSLPQLAVQILKDVLDISIIHELQAVYKFILTGAGGGVFHLDAKHGM